MVPRRRCACTQILRTLEFLHLLGLLSFSTLGDVSKRQSAQLPSEFLGVLRLPLCSFLLKSPPFCFRNALLTTWALCAGVNSVRRCCFLRCLPMPTVSSGTTWERRRGYSTLNEAITSVSMVAC